MAGVWHREASASRNRLGLGMKNQYFGDARDYFKYELLEELLVRVQGLERLVCLWMLTAPDASSEGNVPFAENPRLSALSAFLRRCLDSGNRNVVLMRQYFASRGVDYTPWGDKPPYFVGKSRNQYFASLPDHVLQHALVYFDPDIGMRDTDPSRKHVSFAELASIRARTDDDSLLVIYQHFQRRQRFWDSMAATLRTRIGAPVGYVTEPDVGFFVIAHTARQSSAIDDALESVAASGRKRTVGRTTP